MKTSLPDSISNVASRISKNNLLYNDLLDIQSMILPFKDNQALLTRFSQAELLIFQNKNDDAINILIDLYNVVGNNFCSVPVSVTLVPLIIA